MNTRNRKVVVYWLKPEQKGRKSPPSGTRYSATIRLDSLPDPTQEWSVLLDQMTLTNYQSNAVMGFVSEKAPTEVLQPGAKFQLFEGRWPVAEGRVIG